MVANSEERSPGLSLDDVFMYALFAVSAEGIQDLQNKFATSRD